MNRTYILIIVTLLANGLLARDYHFCSQSGLDTNDGSITRPMQSLTKANSVVLSPGDRMLFRRGSVYNGRFKPQGEGTPDIPVYIGTYGDKQAARPRFNGQGKFEEAVLIYNTRYLHLDGLEITNTGPEPKPRRRGLKIQIDNYGTAQNIKVTNLFIHDVNGSLIKRKGGGSAIIWQNSGKKVKSRFDGLLIEMDNWGGPYPDKTFFANNIIVVADEADFNWGKSKANHFVNNAYIGEFDHLPDDEQAIRTPLQFIADPKGPNGKWIPEAFRLALGSPAIDSGRIIPNNGGEDYFGKPLGNKVNIGPFE